MKNLAKVKSERTFGIEVEFINNSGMSKDQVTSKLNSAFRSIVIESEGYNHTTVGHWKVVTDSSCGLELVSPILTGSKGLKQAQRVIDTLSSIEGVEVNRSCGIHVHVGCDDITVQGMRNVLLHYAKNSDIISSVLAPSRRNGRWAHSLVGSHGFESLTALKEALDNCTTCREIVSRMGGRYKTVNVQCWSRQRTIEFRQHGGSLDSYKILNWVVFLLNTVEKQMTASKVSLNVSDNGVKAFKQVFGESKVVYDYMLGRANHFGFNMFGQVETVEQLRNFTCEDIDGNEYKVIEMSNGAINVLVNDVPTNSNRTVLKDLLVRLDIELPQVLPSKAHQTARQLGKSLFANVNC